MADVLIVGAGLSGIGAACHLQAECPDKSYALLESRGAIFVDELSEVPAPGIPLDLRIDLIAAIGVA